MTAWDSKNEAIHKAASSIASSSSLSSGRIVIADDDPRRKEFATEVDKARRTILLLVWDLEMFEGQDKEGRTDEGAELRFYLSSFKDDILWGLFGIKDDRANYYMDQIEVGTDTFKWRKPDIDRHTRLPRMEGSRESPHKIYIRFKTQVARFHFEDEKKNLHKNARINVNSYFPYWFRMKYDALTIEGKRWKEEVLKHKPYAQFKVEWDIDENEIYIETRTIRQGRWHKMSTDHPSLLKMSIDNFANKQGDGYTHVDENMLEKRRKEYRELNETRRGLNKAERSDAVKRTFEHTSIEEWTSKFSKKSKGMSPMFKLCVNNTNLLPKPKLPNLDSLVDSSARTEVRVRNYVANRDKVMKILNHNNVSKTYVATNTTRRLVDGKPTNIHEAVSVQVPTSLLLISMKTFLCWTTNKSFCVNRNEFISITKESLTKDLHDVPTEWKVHFRHEKYRSKTACVHVYLTKSKLLCQGGQDYAQTTFGLWIWEKVIQPVLDETARLHKKDISDLSAILAGSNLSEKDDKRLKSSAKKPRATKLTRRSTELSQTQDASSHRPLSITFGILPGNDGAARDPGPRDTQETGTSPKDPQTSQEASESVVQPNDDDNLEGTPTAQAIDRESPALDRSSPRGEKTKSGDDGGVEDTEEAVNIDLTSPEFIPRMRRLTSEGDISKIGLDDTIINGPGNDFVSDDYTGLGDIVILELPHDMVPRFKHIYETFTKIPTEPVWSSETNRLVSQQQVLKEIQVHLIGYHREEEGRKIITVTQMLIPEQEGDLHACHITDKDFFHTIGKNGHVGVFHVHPDGSGTYLSGTDCHMCADFEIRTGGPFVSGVLNPVKNEYGFMRIKSEKLEAVSKCSQVSRIAKLSEHAHPEVWAHIAVKEIDVPIIICDLRESEEGVSNVADPFDVRPMIRYMEGRKWTPLTDAGFLQFHGQRSDAGLETLRKPYEGAASLSQAEKPMAKQPGAKHDDEIYLKWSVPVEEFLKPGQGQESMKGILRQKRTTDKSTLKRPGMGRTASEPDIDKLIEDMERLNSLCADLTKANVGLQSELTRMKDAATIFGSTTFEAIDDHSLMARVLTMFGKVLSNGMDRSCKGCDWLGNLVEDLDKNKDKLTDICGWLQDAMCNRQTKTGRSEDNLEAETGCRSLRGNLADKLTVLSWNMNGHRKHSELLLMIDEVQPDIILLQETKLNSSSIRNFQLKFADYYFHSMIADSDVGAEDLNLDVMDDDGGVSIMWKKHLNAKVMKVDVDFGSAVGIIFNSGRSRILLLSIYAPTYGKDLEFSDHLDNLTSLFDREDSKFDEIITLGDWNMNEKSDVGRLEEMDVWSTQRGLIRLDPPKPTHRHFVQKDWTFLDCAYVSDPSSITVNNSELSFITTSDHQPITAFINVKEESRDDGGASERLETSRYEGNRWKLDPTKIVELNLEINRQLKWSQSLPKECSDAKLVGINDTLVKVFNSVMPRSTGRKKNVGLYGLTKERKLLQKLKHNKGRNQRMTSELNLEINELRRKRRSAEQTSLIRKYQRNPSDVFKFVNSLKERGPGCPDKLVVGERTYYDKAAHEEIIQHYDRLGKFDHPLYNEDSQMDPDSIKVVTRVINMIMRPKEVLEDKIPKLTLAEFKEVIKSFPTGKASDLSGVSHDMYRYLNDENLMIIMEWCNNLFDKDDFLSPELSKSRFSLLFKAGSYVSLGNYRRLTVSSVMLRLLERTLMRRGMSAKIEATIEDAQMGFRKSRCYQMALVEITELMRKHKTENSPLFILSTDVAKAFPRQDPRINLLELAKRGLSGGELKFSRDTYLGRKSYLKVNDSIYTKPNVADEYGETEGGTTCPMRAGTNFDKICKAVNKSQFGVEQKGFKTSGIINGDQCVLQETTKKVPVRMMADDALYSLYTMYMAAACYKSILSESKHNRCHYNESKCYLLALNVDFDQAEKKWAEIQEKEGISLKITKKLKYLGLTLSGDNEYDLSNVKAKIGAANGSLRLIAGAGLNQQRLCEPRIRISMVYSYVVSKCLSGLDGLRLSSAAEEKLRQYGDVLMRKVFFLHRNASTHLAHLIAGKIRLNALWRLSQVNLLIRILGLNTHLAEVIRWDFVNETKGSWTYQAVMILEHYGIKDYSRLFLGNVVTPRNAKDIYKAIKEQVVLKEFEYLKMKHLAQKWTNNFDMTSLLPGKPSRHILGATTVQEIRGVTTIVQYLSNSYVTDSVSDKNARCPVCGDEDVRDSPGHLWICRKSTIAKALRQELQEELPEGHPGKFLPALSPILTKFILDPESSLNEEYQLTERPRNFDRISSLCRLIAHFSHQNRYRVVRLRKKKDLKNWRMRSEDNSKNSKKNYRPKSFLDLI